MAGRSRLSARLAAIRESGEIAAKTSASGGEGESPRADNHHLTRRILTDQDWKQVGRYTYEKVTIRNIPCEKRIKELTLIPRFKSIDDLLFFDLETTGLSTGAGSIVFLAGFGRYKGDDLIIRQYFLSDFPGEPEFLDILSTVLYDDAMYVSYNGKCFDSHILSSRFLINGKRIAFPLHLDLLYYTRRLWKRTLGCCTLSSIEEQVLSIHRDGDIPGFLVPQAYTEFLRTGEAGALTKVFEHNEQDIGSLAELLTTIESILRGDYVCSTVDSYGLGKLLLEQDSVKGEKVLFENCKKNDYNSGKLFTLYLKRQGRLKEAVDIWNGMWSKTGSLFAGIELAKYYEHTGKQYRKALEIVDSMLSTPYKTKASKEQLLWRKKRLQRKLRTGEK